MIKIPPYLQKGDDFELGRALGRPVKRAALGDFIHIVQ